MKKNFFSTLIFMLYCMMTLSASAEETLVEFNSTNATMEDDPNGKTYNITIFSPDGQWKMQLNYHSDSMFGTFGNHDKNAPLQPISDIASGGEIVRVMLSLKAILSTATSLPTIVFDEIDTGVSGQIAECMALIMQQMASTQHPTPHSPLPARSSASPTCHRLQPWAHITIASIRKTPMNRQIRTSRCSPTASASKR